MLDRRTFLSTAASLSAVAAVSSCAAPAPAAQHPDAELLALGAEHRLNAARRRALWDAGSYDDDEYDVLWEKSLELQDRIRAIAPITMAGMAVHLRLVYEGVGDRLVERDGPVHDSDRDTVHVWMLLKAAESAGFSSLAA